MLETANTTDSAPGLARATSRLQRRDSSVSAADSTEHNRRFGRAALAARRQATEGGAPTLSSATANPPRSASSPVRSTTPSEPVDNSTAADAASTPPAAEAPAAPRPSSAPPTSALTREAARSERAQVGLAAIAASRRLAASRANSVQNGQSLSALRDTSSGVQQFSSGIVQSDGGRRSTSLFDLPSSGQGLVTRLRGQVRPSSPLTALGSSGASSSSSGLRSLSSLSGANAQRAGLRSAFQSNDEGSRLLLSAASPSRTAGGFGLSTLNRSAFDLLG
ncbi:MAG TPA: hypothetical protein QGF95_18650 [Candidatus Latescibacteria bacterium]|nr:hypothetical protein [Gemmatimonadaceae bacterium]MDP6015407.1 hypothetical protein [Candidatus Latescibacterota bacterium]HJP32568.1 hypothetical protein [Candidatus Latescibacterota bacterium]